MAPLLDDIAAVDVRGDPASTDVRSVEIDSRRVGVGSLFCCVPGASTDGHLHAAEAVERGATALLCERFLDLDVTQARVGPGTVRPAMAALASAFHHHPARALTTVGVTGTNGKTTVAHLVGSVLEGAGLPTGVIGTLDGVRTTPEAPVLQAMLAELRDGGGKAVAMEVSSHALTQHRVDGIVFDVAAFTNLSREHLDHHHSMEEYFEAKASLFEPSMAKVAVVDVDDPWGRRLAERLDDGRVVRVRRSDATDVILALGSSSFRWRGHLVTVPLSGLLNVDNALVAAEVAAALGVSEELVVAGLAAASPVPGRMEVVWPGPPFAVVVDYAHTPAGLEAALACTRRMAGSGRVVCLFGCGGDRDRGKRPAMGAAAARGADVVVLTSDNPRSEDPAAIIDEIRAGVDLAEPRGAGADLVIEPDRARAIRAAVDRGRPGDIVLLAGKGHETTQTAGGRVVPFDDREQARAALAGRPGGRSG